MSKFAEKLQRVNKGSTPALGFRKASEEEIPQMLIVANLAGAGARASKALSGADAVIVKGDGLEAESLVQLREAMGNIPLGLSLEGVKQENAATLIDSGCDFVVFDVKIPFELVRKEGIGRILKIEPSLDPGLVRAVNELPISVDGVLLAGDDTAVTIERLLTCQRFSDLLDKPLLVILSSSVTNDTLSGLCQAGVKAVVLPDGLTAKTLVELKKAIACLPRQAKRKIKNVPILPHISSEPEAVEDEEEEEDI